VLAIYALASALSTGALFALALRETPLPRPSLRGVRETLRDGTSLGLLAIVASGTTAGSAVLLGMLLPPAQVAYFVAAEKLTRPVAYLLDPVNTALMPRLSHLVGTARDRARRLARISLLSMVAIGTLLAIVVAVGAPRFVPLVFGAGYETVVPVTRLMAVVIPLIVANAALAGQWLIPHGLDRWLTTCVVVSALFHFGAAVMVVPQFGAFGMAWAVVGSQALLLLSLAAVLHRHGLIRGLP
jgi:O-antigen/teichoic acid export membrane protein